MDLPREVVFGDPYCTLREFSTVREHAYRLADLFAFLGQPPWLGSIGMSCWWRSANWLRMASGLESVSMGLPDFDDQFGWCSSADEYALAEEATVSVFSCEVARFLYVWGGLESMLDVLRLPRVRNGRDGKIARARQHLDDQFQSKPVVKGLFECVHDLILAKSASVLASQGQMSGKVTPGSGLSVAYQIRNRFAHGNQTFPMPKSEDNGVSWWDSSVVSLSTRVVLLSMQILVLASVSDEILDEGYKILEGGYCEVDLEEQITVGHWLYCLQQDTVWDSGQLSLPLERDFKYGYTNRFEAS
jgi:hypothetical protein